MTIPRSRIPNIFTGVDWGTTSPTSQTNAFFVFRGADGQPRLQTLAEALNRIQEKREHIEQQAQQNWTYEAQPSPNPDFVEYARTDAVHTQKLYEKLYGKPGSDRDLILRALLIIDVRIAQASGVNRKHWERERRYTQLRLQRTP